MLVFRPFEGEVLVGKVKECTPEDVIGAVHGVLSPWPACGLMCIRCMPVSLDFFDDVRIPAYLLPSPST